MQADEADESFHARFSVKRKSYFYLISTNRIVSPFLHRYVWRVPFTLDLAVMKQAMASIAGTHDFSAFRGSGCGAKTVVRTIVEASVCELDMLEFMTVCLEGKFIKFRFEGDAFLRHMVRNMVGTLVEVGKGRMMPGDVGSVMKGADRRCAGPTAPASGLFLERVIY
jgi:tRNA pseudouridine38-40 synthase